MRHTIRTGAAEALLAAGALLVAVLLGASPAARAQTASGSAALDQDAQEPEAPMAIPAAMLRMRDGSIRWGAVVTHAPDGITFQRLDNGGRVDLPWGLLDPGQEQELRERFGYVDLTSEEILIRGDRLVLVDGSEYVGVIVGHSDGSVMLKRESGQMAVPKNRIKQVAVVSQVPALEIYTKEELYSQQLVATDLESAAGQYELGEFCERILDFPHAAEHYKAAQELDGEYKAHELPNRIARVELKAQQQEQIDYLAQVDRIMRWKRYDDALLQLAAFDELYPDSPLLADRFKLEEKVLKARERHLQDLIRRSWYRHLERFAAKAAREKKFQEALAYLEEGMSEDILNAVTADARKVWSEIEPDGVLQKWIERKKGRWKPASYGLGTWLLGEENALAGGPEPAAEKQEQKTEKDAERAALEERIKRFLKNQEVARRARPRQEDEEGEDEKFWTQFSQASRTQWIVAWYAENSGHMEVNQKPQLQNCPTCGGTGVIELIDTGSARTGATGAGIRKEACQTCKTIGRLRRIRYR